MYFIFVSFKTEQILHNMGFRLSLSYTNWSKQISITSDAFRPWNDTCYKYLQIENYLRQIKLQF